MNSVYQQTYYVNTTNVNSNNRLGLFGILGLLQDVSSEHSQELGFGFDDMVKKNIFWVLIRQKVKITRWPKWHDSVTIQTWPKPIKGIYAFREFEIFVDEEKIGECSTTWMILNGENHRPIKAESLNDVIHSRSDYSLDFTAEKVIVPDEFTFVKSFEVRNSDIDMNNHVNNTKYTQWILDSIPFEYHKTHIVKEFEINFTSETILGDTINCQNSISHDKSELFFKGVRDTDQKMVFAAKIVATKIDK